MTSETTTTIARLRHAGRAAEITSICLILAMAVIVSGGWLLAGCLLLGAAVAVYALATALYSRARRIEFDASMDSMDAALGGLTAEGDQR